MDKQHQLFVQCIMSHKLLGKKDFKDMYKLCLEENEALYDGYDTPNAISAFIRTINLQLKDLDANIRKGRDEVTGESYYVYVSTRDAEFKMKIPDYSKQQLEYFKALLEAIGTSDSGCISSTQALNLTNEIKSVSISKQAAQGFLNDFTIHGWLTLAKGKVFLGVSALTEFEQYIKEHFENVNQTCICCQAMVVYGIDCRNCDNRFHTYCLKTYSTTTKGNKCPNEKCQSSLSNT